MINCQAILLILMTCVIKDDDKFYPKLFLEEALFLKCGNKMWWKNYVRKNIISEKKLSDITLKIKKKKALTYIKNNLIDSNKKMYFTVDLSIDIKT